MPSNAAFRQVISLAPNWNGTAVTDERNRREFYSQQGARQIASGEIRNIGDLDTPANSVDLVVQFQNCNFALNNTLTFGANSTAGNLILSYDGVQTANIDGTGGMTNTKIRTALQALSNVVNRFDVEVQTVTAGTVFQVIFRPKAATLGAGAKSGVNRPAATNIIALVQLATSQSSLTVANNTWANINPDGYSAAITVKPGGKVPFSFGSAGSNNNFLGTNFRILVTSGTGQMELSLGDGAINIERV